MTLREKLAQHNPRSAWGKGVKKYAEEFLEFLEDNDLEVTEENMLKGVASWIVYSEGGMALMYDKDIAKRLCTPTELKRVTKKDGLCNPNKRENWLECQVRALYQASTLLIQLNK